MKRRNYFMLDPEKLRPGDIILSTERAIDSSIIRWSTWSDYSHAAIYLGDGLYAEAVDLGVRGRSVTTIVKEHLKVIRLKGGPEAEDAARRAAGRIDHYYHLPYALGSALMALFGRVPSADERALFCSQLVAQAYQDVGVAVVPGQLPVKISPQMLATSPLFEDVTASTAFRTRAVAEHLLRKDFETLGDREVVSVEKMYQELRPLFVSRAIPVPKDWYRMLRFMADVDNEEFQEKLDGACLNALKNSGYIQLLGAVLEETIKPLGEWVKQLDASAFTRDQVALYLYSFTHNLAALKRQAEIDLDNQRFWEEERAKNPELRTFIALAKYAESSLIQRNAVMILMQQAIGELSKQFEGDAGSAHA